jgi:hypothetical protein
MEFLNVFQSHAFRAWSAQVIVVFFLIGGFALLAAGIGLIVNSAGSLRLFGSLNRWVSMRRATRPLEIPHDTRQAVQNYRYWFAAVFIIGGTVALAGLLMRFDARAVIALLDLGRLRPDFAGWLVDGARWILIAGNLLAIIAGLLLAFSPGAVAALEARGSRWISERQLAKGSDQLHLKLDGVVAAYPRNAGWIIVVFALGLIAAFGFLLPTVW